MKCGKAPGKNVMEIFERHKRRISQKGKVSRKKQWRL